MSGSRIIKFVSVVFVLLIVFGGLKALSLYQKVYAPSLTIKDSNGFYLYIKSAYNYDSVIKVIKNADIIGNISNFNWTAERKNYPNHINPGRYLLKNRMSNNELVNILRSGKQEPVQLTFNNVRTINELSSIIASQLEFDSTELVNYLLDTATLKKYNLNKYTAPCLFIPNTYEFFWNTSTEKFVARMYKEYNNFWTKSRTRKAEKLNLSKEEVITMASIVNMETLKNDEKDKIAGVYINRINKGMPLQADPTVIFAIGDFNIRRVLKKHYQISSPYNTYKNRGLPPGPICLPEISSIDAVLNYEKHNYIYFCAKADFSGYHSFARTLTQHNKNARAYQRELNKRRIYR